MTTRRYLNGFEILSEPTLRQTGVARCGGCEATMSNTYAARESHRATCRELQRLDRLAEAAAQRAVRRRG